MFLGNAINKIIYLVSLNNSKYTSNSFYPQNNWKKAFVIFCCCPESILFNIRIYIPVKSIVSLSVFLKNCYLKYFLIAGAIEIILYSIIQ